VCVCVCVCACVFVDVVFRVRRRLGLQNRQDNRIIMIAIVLVERRHAPATTTTTATTTITTTTTMTTTTMTSTKIHAHDVRMPSSVAWRNVSIVGGPYIFYVILLIDSNHFRFLLCRRFVARCWFLVVSQSTTSKRVNNTIFKRYCYSYRYR
jgi:hypothetical protein